MKRAGRIGILYPSDPAGHVPGGVDSFIRGLFKWAPEDLDYTLIGATSDPRARPLGRESDLAFGRRGGRFLPIVELDAAARRGPIPLTLRYLWALQRLKRAGGLDRFDVLDFHRIEPIALFRGDARPKNVVLHTDMSVLRDPNCEIMWRHAPGIYERLESTMFRELDRIYAVRQSAIDRYRRLYPALAERFVFTDTWVDTEVFHPSRDSGERLSVREELGVSADAPLLTFVGRLDRSKDPKLLLAAFTAARAARSDLHLAIVGDGNLRRELASMIAQLGLSERVLLLGARNAAYISRLHRAADIFVLSSLYEGMPIALLEALASGLAIASTRVGEVPSVVVENSTGALAEERTPAALSAAILRALELTSAAQRAASWAAVSPHRPEIVLGAIQNNHRRQTARLAA